MLCASHLEAGMNKTDLGSTLGLAERARWERIVMRHPALALPKLRAAMRQRDACRARAALLGAVFVLERWGRAAELQAELQQALQQAQAQRALAEAAELSEALGRLHYQRGDYSQACTAWSQTLDWASDDARSACLARIGLAHLCYALGDWARGGRVLDQAELHYAKLPRDPYMRAKIALNRAASLRATQGPQAALPELDEALTAARRAGHRDYRAEATYQHARCARDSGDLAQALSLAQQALSLAQGCGYRWLQANAALLLSELQRGDVALGWAGQALTLAEALQSRPLQAAAHGRLGELMREQGELGPSWHHMQQRQRLESSLHQGQLPAQLEALARFDTDPLGADALLLSLSSQVWTLSGAADFERAWVRLRPQLIEALGLQQLQLWWERDGDGLYHGLDGAPASQPLQAGRMPGYLGAMTRADEALQCGSAEHHPWRAELDEVLADAAGRACLDLGLRLNGHVVALLWLQREGGAAWSRADISRAERLAALLARLLASLAPVGKAQPQRLALGELATLAGHAERISELLAGEVINRQQLLDLAGQIRAGAARIERALRES